MRLGVFGGSFDPIHLGHLRLAEEAREGFALDQVLFIPTWVSPFKTGRVVTPPEHRLQMVRLATDGNDAFAYSAIECIREGTSYTVDTLRTLQAENPSAELWFLTGTDAVADLPRWREPEEVLRLTRFAAATRAGTTVEEVRERLAHLPGKWQERISFFPMTNIDISSTDIRARLATGRSVHYLLPPEVEQYIAAHGLYEPVGDSDTIDAG
ncbi:MAG: nicotinate-nucleotide adenylyltransferase [Akkermansiaceae bacterium]|nr:nicotinate-nucleotide adenylyltransferase [Armatimonadota bacterium]